MDETPRQRYRSRRRMVEARRRMIALVAGGAALLIGLALIFRPDAKPSQGTFDQRLAPTALPPRSTASIIQLPGAPAEPPPVDSLPQPGPQISAQPAGAPFFDNQRFTYEPGFYAPQIQAFLDQQPGPLKRLRFRIGDREHSFAEVLVGQSCYYSLNPKVLLALLELHGKLLSNASPTADQLAWGMGFQGENGNKRGLTAQVRWAVRQMVYARRDYPQYAPLTYADGTSAPTPPGMTLTEYMAARALAPTTTPAQLHDRMQAFLETYMRLFGDPRPAPTDWPAPSTPFLSRPMERSARVTSFFDHDAPFLSKNGSTFSYWGRAEPALSYDGHDGWDYALAPPDMALAAADGDVVFAGNADDNCQTRAVVLDHGNGYRTLYWHLARVDTEIGQRVQRGQPIGMIGDSGCALGPHLHLGVQYLGRATDPYGWCGGGTPDPWADNMAGSPSVWLWIDRPSPCAPPPEGATVVDSDSPGFLRSGDGWQTVPIGYGGEAFFIPSVRGSDGGMPWDLRPLIEPAIALYKPELQAAGRYRVLAYVPYGLNGLDDAQRVRYRIQHHDGEAEVIVDQEIFANDWIDLGTYTFGPQDTPTVALSNMAEENQRGVWADVVIWLPATD